MGPVEAALRSELTLARVLRHPLRQRVLFKYAESVTSPSRVAAALDERVNLISYHTAVLLHAACIELVRTEPRRGATEHFYRALVTSEIEDDDWERVPRDARRALVRLTIDASWREAGDALPRGGMDDSTAHISRSFLSLDPEGTRQLAELLRSTLSTARAIEQDSSDRDRAELAPYELVMLEFRRASRP